MKHDDFLMTRDHKVQASICPRHGQVVTDMPPFAHGQVISDMPHFAHLFSGKLQFGHGQVFTTIVTRLGFTDILLASPQFVMLESFH